jgi:PAP2 superfamily
MKLTSVRLASPPSTPPVETSAVPSQKSPKIDALEVKRAGGRQRGAPTVLRINALAQSLVAKTKTAPPVASRLYAMLSVAQANAALAARGAQAQREAIEGASRVVLEAAFGDVPELRAALPAGGCASEARIAGRAVADKVLAGRKNDGAANATSGPVAPNTPGAWYNSQDRSAPGLLPGWGAVETWVEANKQVTPPAPPAFGSAEFMSALADVRLFSDLRALSERSDTPADIQATGKRLTEIAKFWADGPGTSTPPGHWNEIALAEIKRHNLGEAQASSLLAALNMAMMDAGVCCWKVKYDHWLLRPSQADAAITTPVGLPNFPAYVSGHASFSGAASKILGAYFPKSADKFRAMASEAAWSRVYGGIHYAFDGTEGLAMGEKVAENVLAKMKSGTVA